MKKIILSIAIAITTFNVFGQVKIKNEVNCEAANWKLKMVDSAKSIIIDAPSSIEQTRMELKSMKKIKKPDGKRLSEIKYWNSGAPSYRWNQIGPKLIEIKPDAWMRIPTAWMNLAIYDATILAWKEKLKYKRKRPGQLDETITTVIETPVTYSYPCEHSVTAAAAAHVLAYFFPSKADSILSIGRSAGQSRVDAGVQFQSDVDAGWKLGEQVARQVIEKAKKDGSSAVWDGKMNLDPKKWTGKYPLGITLASFTPIITKSPNQFRPPAPGDFEADMKELKEFKQSFKTKSLAYYWANNGGFDFWSEVASLKMFEYNMMNDAPAVARIYTVLHTAYHDVAISIMDAKYAYWGIRPSQYDTTYSPLLSTPPFPGYPSGHAAGAATTSTVLEYFFPADAKQFQQYAKDCADSRFYAGIHFRTDNEVGLKMGKVVGKYIVETWMKE